MSIGQLDPGLEPPSVSIPELDVAVLIAAMAREADELHRYVVECAARDALAVQDAVPLARLWHNGSVSRCL